MNGLKRVKQLILVFFLIFTLILPANIVRATYKEQDDVQAKAKQLLDKLSPEERVGQLFLITFQGKKVDSNSQINDLITNRSIGGVVLRAANDNFVGPDNSASEAYMLTRTLQESKWQNAQPASSKPANYIPLFVGISQEGDGYPFDQILNGLTQLPNAMSIGATWKPEMAEKVGAVLGKELRSLGFNLFMGPSLDVLDVSHTEGGEDLGTRTFGSDPYWVGKMGQAYIRGIHQGSSNQIAVIAKHFPGRGGSDRPPEAEVATVRKSLDQLKQIELAPFFDVTGNVLKTDAATDGLLVSHIRYQGFQGNIRTTTRPVSFDQTALDQIMALEPLAKWRENGGIIVSDNLGSPAVRRFYDPTDRSFNARQVAGNAFLAGNNLLFLDNFVAAGDKDSYTTILRTLEFFAQKYREDPAFAERVDSSVLRILALKFRIYSEFDINRVVPPDALLTQVGQSQQVNFEVAQKAVTLLSPDPAELKTLLPKPPEIRERIVFITDVLSKRQCKNCPEQVLFSVDALQSAVLKLYGPQAGELVVSGRLSSYSFADLLDYLDQTKPKESNQIENDINLADWVVFSFLNIDPKDRPTSIALKRVLSEQPTLLRNKRVIAFAFNAPYYLDATDVSKLTAYYGLYSKGAPFVNVAARILFQEFAPAGALPVTVPGVGYNISTATSPDPNQVIPLMVDEFSLATPQPTGTFPAITPEPTKVPTFKVGDSIPLRTGVIYDHNRNLVPDGTVVRFISTTREGTNRTTQQIDTVTVQGVARSAYRIQIPGLLEIRVTSDPAMTSGLLQLNVTPEGGAAITAIAPTMPGLPTSTPEPTSTPTLTPTSTPTPIMTPQPVPMTSTGGWLLSMGIIWICAVFIFWFGQQRASLRWGVRWGLAAAIGGLLGYIYVTLGLPGSQTFLESMGPPGLVIIIIFGILVGWAVGMIWHRS